MSGRRGVRGISLIEIDIALVLVAVMLLSLYSAMVSSLRMGDKDSVYTEATELCQRQLEDLVLTARQRDQFSQLADAGPVFLGDYNGNSQYFVSVQHVTDLVTAPGDFGVGRVKRLTVQVFVAQPGTMTPTPQGAPLVQLSTVVTSL